MKTRVFGSTGENVSEIGFGAWAVGGNEHGNSYGPTVDEDSLEAIGRAIDLGCTFVDTADVYGHGHSEEIVGKALSGRRKNVFLATKAGWNYHDNSGLDFSSTYINRAVDLSLKRLQTDVIDLYQLHNPTMEMIQEGAVFEPFIKLKEEGKIRFIGVSIFDPNEGVAAMEHECVDAIQVVMNMFSAASLKALLPEAKKRGIAIIAREPLANGFLSGKYSGDEVFVHGDIRAQWPKEGLLARCDGAKAFAFLANKDRTLAQAALQFVLGGEGVSVVIPGAKTVKQVEENMSAPSSPPLTMQDLEQIFEIIAENFH